jgi:Flp pilus assembly protein TadG
MRGRDQSTLWLGTRSRNEKGAVAVEFALVLPVLVMLMFGIFTSGLAYSDHLSITNSVREAARFGSAVDSSSGTVWADSVQTRVQQLYMNGSGTLSPSQICVQLVKSDDTIVAEPTSQGSDCGSAPAKPASMTAGSCVVKVWVRKPAEISLLVSPTFDFTIGAESVSFYGRETSECSTI